MQYELVEDNTVLNTADMGEEQALSELSRLLASPMPRTDRLMWLKDQFDKTAYKRVLENGEIVWENSKGREKWRWVPMIVEEPSESGRFLETETARNHHQYKLDSRNPLRLFESILAYNKVKVTDR